MIPEIKLLCSLVSTLKSRLEGLFIMTEKDCFLGGAEIAVCIVQEYVIAVFICRSYKNQKIIFSKI